jgi:hypothetical protein
MSLTIRTDLPGGPTREGDWSSLLLHVLALGMAIAIACAFIPRAFGQAHPSTGSMTDPVPEGKIILGDVVPFGLGTARSWVQVDANGDPASVGVTLTEAALSGLPDRATPGMIWMVEYILAFPSENALLPFNHVGINWNPHGHVPAGIYNVPHFDFHFYTGSPEDRSLITARGSDLERCSRAPAAGLVPDGYIFAPESEEPGMGGHWIDPESHEFHGESFTSTFIYGTYDGEITFYEPMITTAYLASKPNTRTPVKVSRGVSRDGYYPDSYSVRYDAARQEYSIALEGLTLRRAGDMERKAGE